MRIFLFLLLLAVLAGAAYLFLGRTPTPLPAPEPEPPAFTFFEQPGAGVTGLRGINAAGDMVGYYQTDADPNSAHALLIRGGVLSTIDPPRSTRDRRAFGITDAGLIAISYDGRNTYLWDGATTYTPVVYPGAPGTVVRGLNEAGDVAGEFTDAADVTHAFVRIGGVFAEVAIPGAARASVRGINNAGVSVGYTEAATGARRCFMRAAAGGIMWIDYPGAASTMCGDINNHGVIVGAWIDAAGRFHGFVWRDGAFTDVDAPGAQDTLPLGINDAGDIVGEISIGGSYLDYTVPHRGFFTSAFR